MICSSMNRFFGIWALLSRQVCARNSALRSDLFQESRPVNPIIELYTARGEFQGFGNPASRVSQRLGKVALDCRSLAAGGKKSLAFFGGQIEAVFCCIVQSHFAIFNTILEKY